MKILVIEDSVRLADTIAEALQNENYAVDIANDVQIGYEHASTGIYDMIILDLMLPKMNGYEVLSALRRDGDNVPVLILSAKTERLFNLSRSVRKYCYFYISHLFSSPE